MKVSQEHIQAFVDDAQAIVDTYRQENFPRLDPVVLSVEMGRKFAKIVRSCRSLKTNELYDRSVYCFLDVTNGDVLKAASWKAPAKGARGNIFDETKGLGRITPYGAEYNI